MENKKKNRYPDKLPYDHNRVMLNALVNGSNSDYINASSVMDHDPRNPAYIITQVYWKIFPNVTKYFPVLSIYWKYPPLPVCNDMWAQGAMTNTTADFWQMVWEQGSVVIVMLSK